MPELLSTLSEHSNENDHDVRAYWTPMSETRQKMLTKITISDHEDQVRGKYEAEDLYGLMARQRELEESMKNMALWSQEDIAKAADETDEVKRTITRLKGK